MRIQGAAQELWSAFWDELCCTRYLGILNACEISHKDPRDGANRDPLSASDTAAQRGRVAVTLTYCEADRRENELITLWLKLYSTVI